MSRISPHKPRISLATLPLFHDVSHSLRSGGLVTVCEEARCPNKLECWNAGTATFMILGDTCTRHCGFCSVKTAAHPLAPELEEPIKIASSIASWGLSYVVITSVDRDDLDDQGAGHFAKTCELIKQYNPNTFVELLVPDFQGCKECLDTVLSASPDVLAHNVETIPRLQSVIRDSRASFEQSLSVLEYAKSLGFFTKSSLMLGFGESREEVVQAMSDLRGINTDFLTLGQYLQPSKMHLPVAEYVLPKHFKYFQSVGEDLGFSFVASGPLVRSSYRAGEFFFKAAAQK